MISKSLSIQTFLLRDFMDCHKAELESGEK